MMDAAPLTRGFVLTGGHSTRMGRDKALLSFGTQPLASWMAELVRHACPNVSLLGAPDKYSSLGWPVIADTCPGVGPLGGIHAALAHSDARWNLIVACDLPYLSAPFLKYLVLIAEQTDADVVLPESEEFGYEPLCAVYAQSCRTAVEEALRRGERKINRVLTTLRLLLVTCRDWKEFDPQGKMFRNVNTAAEYEQARRELADRSERAESPRVRRLG